MADSPEDIKKHTKLYLLIGAALFVGTVLTVAVAKIPAFDFGQRGFDHVDFIIGMIIATIKSTLVAAIFMHLNHEKKGIYWIFFGSFAFFAALGGLTALAIYDPIHDPLFPGAKPGYEGQYHEAK